MARTACSEACLAVYLHENSFSVSRALAAHVTAPLSSGRAARSRRKVSWVHSCSGRLLGCPEIQYGRRQLGMERTTTNSLVPFQPFQPGRNKLRHALSVRILYHQAFPTVLLYFIFRSLPLRDDVIYMYVPFMCCTSRVPPLNLSRHSPRPGVQETR